MFGWQPTPSVSRGETSREPPPLPKVIITEPLALTAKRLHDALYCTAPCGPSQLAQHLAIRGYDNSPAALERAMRELVASGVNVGSVMSEQIGGKSVALYTIPGQER